MKPLFFLAFIASLFPFAAEGQTQKKAQGPVYIIHSRAGTLTPSANQQTATLMLSYVDQTVPYVYSHPVRKIGAERLAQFLQTWAAGGRLAYDKDPPDAHLLFYNPKSKTYEEWLIELLHIDLLEKEDELSFQIRSLSDQAFENKTFGEVTLFIDCFPFCI